MTANESITALLKDDALRVEVRQDILDTSFAGNNIEASVQIERRAHDGTLWDFYLHIEADVHVDYHAGDLEEPPSYPEVQLTRVCQDDKLDVNFELTDREEDNLCSLLFEEYETYCANYEG